MEQEREEEVDREREGERTGEVAPEGGGVEPEGEGKRKGEGHAGDQEGVVNFSLYPNDTMFKWVSCP